MKFLNDADVCVLVEYYESCLKPLDEKCDMILRCVNSAEKIMENHKQTMSEFYLGWFGDVSENTFHEDSLKHLYCVLNQKCSWVAGSATYNYIIERAHLQNRIDFLSELKVDIYHPEFCEVDYDDHNVSFITNDKLSLDDNLMNIFAIETRIRNLGKLLLSDIKGKVIRGTPLNKALAEAAMTTYMEILRTYANSENDEYKTEIFKNSMVIAGFHVRMCGLWLEYTNADLYYPEKYNFNLYMKPSERKEFIPTMNILVQLDFDKVRKRLCKAC